MTSFCSSRNCHAHNAVSLGQAPLLRQESSASDALLERIAAPPPANHKHAARSRIAKLNCGRVQVTGRLLHKQLVQLVPFLPAGSDVAVGEGKESKLYRMPTLPELTNNYNK